MREESDSSASALQVLLTAQSLVKRSGHNFLCPDDELNALMKDCEFPEEPKIEQSEKKGYGGW